MVSIVSQIETDHEDMIHDAQMNYYGTRLATCSSDKSIRIYSTADGNQSLIATLEGHDGPVWQISWAHPSFGNILASCSYDRKVFIWREEDADWTKVYEFDGHESSVNSISWAPKEFGLILATASSDGSFCVLTNTEGDEWEYKKCPKAHSIGCNAISWCPSIPPSIIGLKPEAAADQKSDHSSKRLVTGGCDNLVKIWKYNEGEDKWDEEHKLEGHSDWVRDVAWGPSIGQQKSYIASCSQDHRVIIWSKDISSNRWNQQILNMFDDVVWHVSWSIMGNILAVSSGDNRITVWKQTLSGNWTCISDQLQKQQNS